MVRPQARLTILHATEYQQQIPFHLAKHPVCQIHSMFQNGLNIKSANRLFFIGTVKNGRLPFGIHLTPEQLQQLLNGITEDSSVSWEPNERTLSFGETGPVVSIVGADPFDWRILRAPITSELIADNLTMLVAILLEEPRVTGLDIDIESWLTRQLQGHPANSLTEQHLFALLDVMESSNTNDIEQHLRFLIGRGQGLTPSGDDHLVGLLAIHEAAGILSNPFVETLRRLIEKERLTTDIGREYLLYALDGQFSSTVVQSASELTRKTDIYMLKPLLSELLDMGHSSGIDTVFGMLLGLLTLRRKLE
ncbi:DUF2877 domain-containing protein [Sporosarcina gallistercoris]|uniref:DUF2877 domain-containing protein n=1 Tax=Sporosarcina gallistercoris TaxID=2762245 RepID=A0ABR8PHM1_9BACL|nr:DUF2877 domain-containing protein [Sporosarcina gallistercoris]MBD7907666.1 DUF2877 domain-containing protein [Sporosarcina gallistercoris]